MKYKITMQLKEKKIERICDDEYELKDFITDWGNHGIHKFKVDVLDGGRKKEQGK